jgi:hypothetical protein
MRLLSTEEARSQLGVVVPVYFSPEVAEERIRLILERTFQGSCVYCPPENLLAVVDQGSRAENVLDSPLPASSLDGLRIHRLKRNRAKAGAVAEGLKILLDSCPAQYIVTRDCDGDHILEDIPRLVSLAYALEERDPGKPICVMGARPSLAKPMGWLREEWERLTNRVLLDLVSYLLAQQGDVIDRRYWNGLRPDIQSGYRVYSRVAARRVVDCLTSLPNDRSILTFSCEFLPFVELLLQRGLTGQVNRLTLVEQPVSSYAGVDYAEAYGRFFAFCVSRYGVPEELVLRFFDNHLPATEFFFSDEKTALLRCRELICPGAAPPDMARFL